MQEERRNSWYYQNYETIA